MYGFDDMYRVLTMMCTNKASGSSEAGALSDLQDSGKTPSSRWVLGKIRAIDAREIRERCDHAIKREVEVHQSCCCGDTSTWWAGTAKLAIHNPLQVEKREGFYSLATGAWPADPGPRLGPGSYDGDVVSKLLEKCSELRIRSSRVLLVAGFFRLT